jgi:acyl carrier protein
MNAAEIREIIAIQLGLNDSEVTDEKTFDQLYADSLDRVEIVITIEDEMEMEIDDSQFTKEGETTVGEFIAAILKTKEAA